MSTKEKSKEELIHDIRKKREDKLRKKRIRKTASVIAVITALVMTSGAVLTASAREISITEINEFDGIHDTKTVYTFSDESVGEILEKNNVAVSDTDKINVSVDSTVSDDQEIIIKRGKEITIVDNGVETNAVVTKADAHEALVEAGIIPGEADEITLDSENVKESSKIERVSISETEEVTEQTIENGVDYVDDPTLASGETKVVNEGCAGTRTITSRVTYKAGEETSRETISDVVSAEPQNKVIAVGTKTPEPTQAPATTVPEALSSSSTSLSDDGGTINGMSYSKKITMTATAYSTSPSENGGYTVSAMGNQLGYGIVAVDPSVVPLGSTVYVAAEDGSWSYGVASAEDTGGAIKGNRIDLCYDGSVSSVNMFGRRTCVVYILD